VSKAYIDTPIGILEIVATLRGIRSIRKVERKGKDADPMPDLLDNCITQLGEYFAGRRKEFKLALDWSDEPEFHQAVWREVLQIPYGHTTSYLAIADKLGNPKAVRAVGQANAHNPIAI
ncbi:methylated-DNA--[protein]-cysteine S-methyltransferase, partial [Arthrospira platensis SPKY1]|nr:methylated-DNA--[protein]-cysteine S-methyltransferase [Arthrospira platensis SPKY1]